MAASRDSSDKNFTKGQAIEKTAALAFPVQYPLAERARQSTEVGQYYGKIESLEQKKAKYEMTSYPAHMNVVLDAALIKEMLGVESIAVIGKPPSVVEFIIENGKKWSQALNPAQGVIKAVETIGKQAVPGSLLKGVCDTIATDLTQCRNEFLKEANGSEPTLKGYQRMCALLREAKVVIAAQGIGIGALPAKRALMLLKLQNLHTKYDQFSRETGQPNVGELHDLSEKLGQFGIHDPSIYTQRLFTEDELKRASIDTLKDSMDTLVDTMKRSMAEREWTTNTGQEGGRSKPFAALEQELISDFDLLIRAEVGRQA